MKRAVTGIKPTGTLHLGNYLGMIRPALALADDHDAFYFIADLHALTLVKNGDEVRRCSYELAAALLALGLDPVRSTLYRQSDVPEVCELAWILSCLTPKGLLNRAHAYKAAVDANRRQSRDPDDGVNAGLFNYPVLMAADILAMAGEVVPVGLDQKQHLEIAGHLAGAFNASYGPLLRVPQPAIEPTVMVIPGTDGRKMSKSYGNVIPILEPPAIIRKAVMRIVTDSRPPEEPKDPERDLLFRLYALVSPADSVTAMADRYRRGGSGYGEVKQELAAALEDRFRRPRERYCDLLASLPALQGILATGAERARAQARPILDQVRRAAGMGVGWSALESARTG